MREDQQAGEPFPPSGTTQSNLNTTTNNSENDSRSQEALVSSINMELELGDDNMGSSPTTTTNISNFDTGPIPGTDQFPNSRATSQYSLLSTIQQQAVDEAFQKLFGYAWGTTFPPILEPITTVERVLCQIWGPIVAGNILQGSPPSSTIRDGSHLVRKDKVHRATQCYKYKSTSSSPSIQIPVTKQTTTTNDSTPVSITTGTLQGRATTMEDSIIPSTDLSRMDEPTTTTINTTKKISAGPRTVGGGMKQILEQITGGPTKVSTVAKTSADWDQFKEQTGLAGKIEEKAESKEAYLKRQEFLTRVDHRKFEIEREERERNRIKQQQQQQQQR